MKTVRYKELGCVVVLVVFILLLCTGGKTSKAKAEDVFASACSAADTSMLSVCKDEKFKKEFGFGVQEFDGVCYMASDSIMEVREILVVKTAKTSPSDELIEKIKSRIENKAVLFKGYAPEQSALLEDYTLVQKGNFILFTVSDSSSKIEKAFKKAL